MTPAQRAALASAVVAAVVALCSCTDQPPTPARPAAGTASSRDAWRQLSPAPEGTRLLALSSGHGSVLASGERPGAAGGLPTPVLVGSTDGATWKPLTLAPATLYGEHAALLLMATDGHSAAMVGQRSGGAHGIPRFTTWSGSLARQTETGQPFELFGGPASLGVSALAGSGSDALTVGGWVGPNGAADIATWRLRDGSWSRSDDVPAFRSDRTHLRQARGVARTAGGYLVVGAVTDLSGEGVVSRATVWRSGGGTWTESTLPGTTALSVDCRPGTADCLVVGTSGSRLAGWRLAPGEPPRAQHLPGVPVDQTSRAWVCVSSPGNAVVAVRTGDSGSVVVETDGRWHRSTGVGPAPQGLAPLGAACTGQRLLVLAGGTTPSLWALDS